MHHRLDADGWPIDGTPYLWRMPPRAVNDAGPPTIHRPLQAVYRAGRKFELIEDWEYESAVEEDGWQAAIGRFIVQKGTITDFHSTPRIVWSVFPPDDWGESAVAHDQLVRAGGWTDQLGVFHQITRKQADRVHREVLLLLGAPQGRANTMYVGLRWTGWRAWNNYRKGKPWPT